VIVRIVGLGGSDPEARDALAVKLLAALKKRGGAVSLVFLDEAEREYDQPGKDSHRHLQAGAVEAALVGRHAYAISAGPPATLETMLARLAPVDLVLVIAEKLPRLPIWIELDGERVRFFSDQLGGTELHTFSIEQVDMLCDAVKTATPQDKSCPK
jgi:molybdopterin-guanine dinucleotide biosynthesis protein MobB